MNSLSYPQNELKLGSHRFTAQDVVLVAKGKVPVVLTTDPFWVERIQFTRAAVEKRIKSGPSVYGVTTGFGASCENEINSDLSLKLPALLFAYHGCGVGEPLSELESATVLVCRLVQLCAGYSGIRLETLEALLNLFQARIFPKIPSLGSVGASGDLTPLSYVAAVLSGEREAYFQGLTMEAARALSLAGLAPHPLLPKESLSIMNGTSVMTALTCLALERVEHFSKAHAVVTAWNVVLLKGQEAHFDARIFEAKKHPGSAHYAKRIRAILDCEQHPPLRPGRVQDLYSIRCSPHVVGILLECMEFSKQILEKEIQGAGDNPLVCPSSGDILHGGNFYGGHVGFVADMLKAQVASSAELLERQLMLLCDPHRSRGLPENLVLVSTSERSLHHGFKAMEILASSLIAECMKLTMPASSFSRSTEGHNQDKVPMGALATRDLLRVLDLCETVLAINLLAAAQASDARGPGHLPPKLMSIYHQVRELVPANVGDRRQDRDIECILNRYRDDDARLKALLTEDL